MSINHKLIALVCGGRYYSDQITLYQILNHLKSTQIICGGASGADALAESWARDHGIPCQIEHADWRAYGPGAGPIRNQRMLTRYHPSIVVAFPGGRGTADMVKRAKLTGITLLMANDMSET